MPFVKGKKKTGGRKKGTVSKKRLILDSFAQSVCDGGMQKFNAELNKLEGKEFVNAYLQLFEYVKPKLSRAEVQADVKAVVKRVGYGEAE